MQRHLWSAVHPAERLDDVVSWQLFLDLLPGKHRRESGTQLYRPHRQSHRDQLKARSAGLGATGDPNSPLSFATVDFCRHNLGGCAVSSTALAVNSHELGTGSRKAEGLFALILSNARAMLTLDRAHRFQRPGVASLYPAFVFRISVSVLPYPVSYPSSAFRTADSKVTRSIGLERYMPMSVNGVLESEASGE